MTPLAIERIHLSCFERSVLQAHTAWLDQRLLVYANPGRKGPSLLAPGRLRDLELAGPVLRLCSNLIHGEGSIPVRFVPARVRP